MTNRGKIDKLTQGTQQLQGAFIAFELEEEED
jgi:hypothetical protein